MEGHSLLLFCSGVLVLCLPNSAAVDTIAANQVIRDGDTIVSAGERYELGFFSPGKSKNRYAGIWYKKISTCTAVWVANRENPLTNKFGVLKVSSEGILLLLSGDTVIWSSNSSISLRKTNPVAQLLDTGNLVVRNGGSDNQVNYIWQSFDYPSDTLLPGMKLGKDLVTGIDRQLTSWMSPDDPSPGPYVNWVDTHGFPQIFVRQGSNIQWRIGPWNGLRLGGVPMVKPNGIFSYQFVVNKNEVYFKYELLSSVVQRMSLKWDGNTVHLNWVDRKQEWIVFLNALVDSCSRYALCGPFGSCSINKAPLCSCMEGFEPKRPEEWEGGDWSGGCQRKKPLDCRDGDLFQKVSGARFPDTRNSWYDWNTTLGECELACKSKCNCTAYADLDVRNGGSGCLLWFNELLDIRETDEKQDLYLRMAASALIGQTVQSGFNKKIRLLIVVLSASSILLVLLGLSLALNICSKKRRWSHMKRQGVQQEDLDQLPFFSLYELAKATNYFSIDNKIGEGGFGPVYKGMLEDGQRVAVKRLSKTSEQGLDEFKNEVVCIAKLQHRNLVRLLGYCIHRDEMILIYEYMANKSLDSFLFDEAKSSMLQWPQRFSIIHGIARGILYLHQDSRLQIIHRDLKASNVLLDDEMNPRISDFGLARRFVGYDTTAQTKNVAGTYGYMPPEYALHGRFSVKSDVFGFGVLVLEIVSGKKNREFCFEDHSGNLLGHAWRFYKENRSLELVSAYVRDSCIVSEALRSIQVGLLCVQHHPQDRPSMSSVVVMLSSEVALNTPKQPAFFTENGWRELSVSSVDEATITLLDAR